MRYLLLLCLLFVGCSKTEKLLEQKVRVSISNEPTSLDPRKARDLCSTETLHMLFEGLTRLSPQGKIELALAKEVEISKEGLRYTFLLKNTCWSNGEPLTAEDFVSSWRTVLDPNFPTDNAYHLYVLKNAERAKKGEISLDEIGIYAKDPLTLVIELEKPTPYLFELFTIPIFFPVSKEVVKKDPNWASKSSSYVCNGPFRIDSWNHSDSLFLLKNEKYWDAASVKLEKIDLFVVSDDTGIQMFEGEKLDWTGSSITVIPPEAIPSLKEEGILQISPFAATYFYRVNTKPEVLGKPNPLSNPKLRRALAAAIDREEITEHILQGGHTPAFELVPLEMGLKATSLDWEDLEEKIEEPIILSYVIAERNAAIAQAVQKQWEKKLGILIELEAVEPKTFFQRVSQGQFQLAAGSWVADFNDPINFLEVFKYKVASTNNTGWENREYIDLLNRSQLCREEERRAILSEAEKILLEEMPMIPIFHFAMNYLKKEGLEGVLLSSLGRLDFRFAYWDTKEKR